MFPVEHGLYNIRHAAMFTLLLNYHSMVDIFPISSASTQNQTSTPQFNEMMVLLQGM